MKKIFYTLVFIVLSCYSYSQNPTFAWGKLIGYESIGNTAMFQIHLDKNGNSYIYASSTNDINLGNGIIMYREPFYAGVSFFAKFDPAGLCLWAKKIRMGSAENKNITTDNNGNIYIISSFMVGTAIDNYTFPAMFYDNFAYSNVLKLDPNGNLLWCAPIPFKTSSDNTKNSWHTKGYNSIRINPEGQLVVTGCYQTDTYFCAKNDTISLLKSNEQSLSVYIAKYDFDGNILSANKLGEDIVTNPPFAYLAEFIDMDQYGNIYRYTLPNRRITKYDPELNVLKTDIIPFNITHLGGGDKVYRLDNFEVDRLGNIYIAGLFCIVNESFGTRNIKCHIAGLTIPKYGKVDEADAFLVKLNANTFQGEWYGLNQFKYGEEFSSITTDELNNVYVAGAEDGKGIALKFNSHGQKLWSTKIQYGIGTQSSDPPSTHAERALLGVNGGNVLIAGHATNRIQMGSTVFEFPYKRKAYIMQFGVCNTPSPSIIAENTTFCAGDSVLLTASGGVGNYTWVTGDTTQSIYAHEPYSYSVISQSDSVCYGKSDVLLVNKLPLPEIEITASDSVICVGNQATLTVSGNATSYNWNNGITNGVPFSPTNTASYTAVGMGENGCSNKDSVLLKVLSLPEIEITASDSVVCIGNQATLTANGAISYTWDNGITNEVPFSPTNTASYTVIGTDVNGCSNVNSMLLTVIPLQNVEISLDENLVLSSNVQGSNQWYFDDVAIPNATGATFAVTQSGSYYVIVSDSYTCESKSNTIYVDPYVSINEQNNNAGISLYPNPSSGKVYFSKQANNIEVTNVLGRVVLTATETSKIDISNQCSGVYFVSFFDKDGNVIQCSIVVKE